MIYIAGNTSKGYNPLSISVGSACRCSAIENQYRVKLLLKYHNIKMRVVYDRTGSNP